MSEYEVARNESPEPKRYSDDDERSRDEVKYSNGEDQEEVAFHVPRD